jgi:polar amino acid transport system substrate-binding protein
MRNRNRFCPFWINVILIILCLPFLSGCDSSVDRTNIAERTKPEVEEPVSDKILIVTGEYAPYTTELDENRGFLTELMEEVLNESGIDYEIKFYPWKRCMEMVDNGEAWASFPYGYSKEYAQTYDYSTPIIKSRHRFYYLNSNDKIEKDVLPYTKISDFTNYTFGGANGYWYGTRSDLENHGVKVEWANDTDALIKMLHSGRIDFFIEDELVCDEAIGRIYPDETNKFSKLPNDAMLQEYFLLISKNYNNTTKLQEQFNNAFVTLENNGKLNNLLKKNGLGVEEK